ncbi:putative outermembrane protein [hydrothermal vent metagenome]|uniref:Putative outermembrane protein n=1 Tax=hydrothermal vent metagenome TaxID=652676 RepID=A0A3B0YW26_9ZZZZ
MLLLFDMATATAATPADNVVAYTVQQALAQDDYWLKLVHYKRKGKGYLSQVDDTKFFTAPDGKTSPNAELAATLQAFFQPGDDDSHPQCRFPARLYWLNQQLDLSAHGLPVVHCNALKKWLTTLNAEQATLIFPAAYLNSPSSMFGHTLLRLTPSDHRKSTPLAAYALNYAANADEDDGGLAYSFKGLFGGYPGLFSIVPYYEKIKQYSDIESRDIWEYDLNLNQAEIDQLMRHAWEVKNINFDYYFLTENCSYHVLSLLEVARPGSQLTDDFSIKAIPSDTVRAVIKTGMADRAIYRPATTTLIRQRLALLDTHEKEQVIQLATGTTLLPREQAGNVTDSRKRSRILELAYDYSRYRSLQQTGSRTSISQDYQLLIERSRLPAGNVWPPVQRPAYQPEQGHQTTRLAVGGGSRSGDSFISLRFRPAYHDILDPPAGYSRGGQINFLDLRARYVPTDNSLQLDRFTLIDILSLSPRDKFFKPISWGVDTGIERMLTRNGRATGAQVGGSSGLSYRMGQQHLLYFLLKGRLKVARAFQDNYSLGGGLSAGSLLSFEHSTAELSLTGIRFALGETDTTLTARWRQSFPIGKQRAFRYRLEQRHERNRNISEIEIMLNWYY